MEDTDKDRIDDTQSHLFSKAFQLTNDVAQVIGYLESILERESSWTGEAWLEATLFYSGVARFNSPIGLNERIDEDHDYRWRTILHEALHKFSNGLTSSSYALFPGWEEGVVEQLQRLLRQEALQHVGVTVNEERLTAYESAHSYNRYIERLEELRLLLQQAEQFYHDLLKVPLSERATYVRNLGEQLPPTERARFRSVFLIAVAVLSR